MGLTPQQRRWFDALIAGVVTLFGASWIIAVVQAVTLGVPRPAVAGTIARNPLSSGAPALTPRLLDAALQQFAQRTTLRGHSGAVRVVVQPPDSSLGIPDTLAGDAVVEYATTTDTVRGTAPPPGVWNVLLRIRDGVRQVPDLTVLSLVPLTEKRNGRIGQYLIGSWPNERGGARSAQYTAPRGMVRVTPENLDLPVSRHFLLRHFVTKGQANVWPKYVLLSPKVLDKIELTIDALNSTGTPVTRVGVISGFRTPSYNAGGGDTSGRGALSRHMYGDAMDWFVDNDGDGRMDDLNRDGRVDVDDGRVIVKAAESVERKFPDLIGGIGLYRPTGAHSGFVHLDTRGYRARW